MKKTLFLFCSFLTLLLNAQKTPIKLNVNIKDPHTSTKSLTLLDLRENKEIGSLAYGDELEMKSIDFQPNPEQAFTDWYFRYNKELGDDTMVLVLKKLSVSDEKNDEKTRIAKTDISAGIFIKKDNQYNFVTRVDTTYSVKGSNIQSLVLQSIPYVLGKAIKKSYSIVPWKNSLTKEELPNYENVLQSQMSTFKNEPLKNGIYKNYFSFFTQNPEEGTYSYIKDDKGNLTRAIGMDKDKKRVPARQIYAYIENGKAFRNTAIGFQEIFRDDKGYYLLTNHASLFPEQMDSSYGMFGLIGAIAGSIAADSANKKNQVKEKVKFYLDPLTGNYTEK
ncbi:MAG: hypothetical protein KBA33_00360 [Cloacibacterium sp.]|jgi:hypothetical protein|nr:hypothetical protein [Cloacibacterium sp.]